MSFPLVEKRVKFSTSSATISSGKKLCYAPSASGKFLSIAGWPRPSANVIVADFPTLWEINPGPGGPDFLRYRSTFDLRLSASVHD